MPHSVYRFALALLLMCAFAGCETAKPDETPRLIMDPPEETEPPSTPPAPPYSGHSSMP